MNIKRPEIKLDGIQIKSLDIARVLCAAVQDIEIACGIHSTRITIVDPFICPDIDLDALCQTPTEILIRKCLEKIQQG